MKNIVDDIIDHFSRQELREFKYFLLRQNQAGEREDIKLVDSIRKKENEDHGKHAPYQTRKRLKVQLEQFMQLQNVRSNEVSKVYNFIEVSRYLFRKNLYKHAWNYLKKAEETALEMEEFGLLDHIYYIQTSYSSATYLSTDSAPEILTLLDKQEQNFPLAITDIRANSAYALLMHEIGEVFTTEFNTNIDELISKVLKRYQLEDKIYESPRLYLRIVNITCRALLENKEYIKLKEYGMECYQVIAEKKMTAALPFNLVIEFLKFMDVASIRTKDYENTEKYLLLAKQAVENSKGQDDIEYHSFMNDIGMCDLYMCTGRLEDARKILLLLQKKYSKMQQFMRLHFILSVNLISMHFKCNEYSDCIRLINELMQQDQEKLLQTEGVEILLLTEIYEAIIHYENDQSDGDYVFHLLGRIRKKYAEVLARPELKRENMFVKMMMKMTNERSYIKSKLFHADYDKFIALKQYMPGDKEYISLNAWLTSRYMLKPYYECFLKEMH